MTNSPLRAAAVVALTVSVSALVTAAPATADDTATVYLVQGVAGTTASMSVDGKVVQQSAAAKTIVGPLRLSAGVHTVAVDAPGTAQDVTSSITVKAGDNVDAVVHRQADPNAKPEITTYVNDLSAIPAGTSRLTVAHTAAVGPADIRVKQKVLFANIANGEELTLTVPAGTYPIEIVPTATTGPVVLGPVDLPVKKGTLTRVFAIGVAATGSMDAVVQELPLATRGSGSAPATVDAGNGGQAQRLITTDDPTRAPWFAAAIAFVALLTGRRWVVLRSRR